jgi:hypothetical protein
MSASPARKQSVSVVKAEKDTSRSIYEHSEILERILKLKQEKQGLPPSIPGADDEIDQLCLMQAFHGVVLSLSCDIAVFSEHYYVPEDVLTAIVADWLISKRMGVKLLPIELFGPY